MRINHNNVPPDAGCVSDVEKRILPRPDRGNCFEKARRFSPLDGEEAPVGSIHVHGRHPPNYCGKIRMAGGGVGGVSGGVSSFMNKVFRHVSGR